MWREEEVRKGREYFCNLNIRDDCKVELICLRRREWGVREGQK